MKPEGFSCLLLSVQSQADEAHSSGELGPCEAIQDGLSDVLPGLGGAGQGSCPRARLEIAEAHLHRDDPDHARTCINKSLLLQKNGNRKNIDPDF